MSVPMSVYPCPSFQILHKPVNVKRREFRIPEYLIRADVPEFVGVVALKYAEREDIVLSEFTREGQVFESMPCITVVRLAFDAVRDVYEAAYALVNSAVFGGQIEIVFVVGIEELQFLRYCGNAEDKALTLGAESDG